MKKALIVVDMQNDFVTGSLGSAQAAAIVENVCKKIRAWDGEIFFTRDTHEEDTYMATTEGKGLPVMHCIKNTYGWDIEESVKAALLEKLGEGGYAEHGYDKTCFGSPTLGARIAKEFDYAELIGLCTDVCVISNAVIIRNQHPHMQVTVDASCCAGVTMEGHGIALAAMKSCGITVLED